jgi:hypothetical protein
LRGFLFGVGAGCKLSFPSQQRRRSPLSDGRRTAPRSGPPKPLSRPPQSGPRPHRMWTTVPTDPDTVLFSSALQPLPCKNSFLPPVVYALSCKRRGPNFGVIPARPISLQPGSRPRL